jgi:signal transduction histidine kinase
MFSGRNTPRVQYSTPARSPNGEVTAGSPALVLVIAVAAVVAIGVVDYSTGPLWSMSVFYLVPIAWATASAGRRVGVALAMLCALVGVLSDVVLQPGYGHKDIAAANVAVMFATLLAIVELVHRQRQRALRAFEAEQESRDFLAFAAHQLRTPLAGIGATVDAILVSANTSSERDELLIRLGTETTRAGRLLNSLLRVAQLDQHGHLPLRQTELDRLVRGEVERARRRWPAVLWTQHRETDGTQLDCNPEALAEALANLLDNGGRHARTRVDVTLRSVSDLVEIDVHDDGPGLPLGKVDAAFRRFVSMDGHGGTGLGLPIARGIAEAHRGTLVYETGSFTIRIPQTTQRSPHPHTTSMRPDSFDTSSSDTPVRLPK